MGDNKKSTRSDRSESNNDRDKRRKADRRRDENPIYKNLPRTFTFRGKTGRAYRIMSKIGEGGMGAVYEVKDKNTGKKYAVKCEGKRRNREPHLIMEKLVYKEINSRNWPKLYDSGDAATFCWIAMQLVGPSLHSKLKESPTKKFTSITCLKIATQILSGLQKLHKLGVVHRDLKPENIAIGLGDQSKDIILFDVGIARRYKNPDGTPHRPRKKTKFKGTRQFAPLCMHHRAEYGPRDDLESFLYIMSTFLNGSLPWKGKRPEELKPAKEACRNDPQALFPPSEVSGPFTIIWNYVTRLSYEDMIDYGYMIQLLIAATKDLGGEDRPFEWETTRSQDTTQTQSTI